MKNRLLNDFGGLFSIISFFSMLFTPIFNMPTKDNPFTNVFYWICSIICIIFGFFLLSYPEIGEPEKGNLKLFNIIFLIGLLALTYLNINNIINIYLIQIQMAFNDLLSSILINQFLILKTPNFDMIMLAEAIKFYRNPQLNLPISFIYSALFFFGLILSIGYFFKIKAILKIMAWKMSCPICYEIIQDKKQYCYFCGANLKFFKPESSD